MPPTLDDVIQVWNARQAAVRTAELTWEQSRQGMNRWSNYQSAWLPQNKSRIIQPGNSLKISDGRVRYETNRWYHRIDLEYAGYYGATGLEFAAGRSDPFYRLHLQEPASTVFERVRQGRFSNPTEQVHDAWRLSSLFDGRSWTDFFEKPPGPSQPDKSRKDLATHSEAVIRGIKADKPLPFSQIMEDLFFRPILLLYRPFDPALGGCRPESWEFVQDEIQVDGRTCLLIREPGIDEWDTHYFVDPEQEFAVVRAVIQQNKKTRAQLDVRYRDDFSQGPVPAGWLAVLFSDQTDFPGQDHLPFYATAEVTSFALNEPLADEDFQQKPFPADTLVVDQTKREVYITRQGGGKRIVTRAEMSESDADFAQVAATSSGYAPRRSQSLSPNGWLLAVTGGTFGIALVLSVWKRYRRVHSPETVATPTGEIGSTH